MLYMRVNFGIFDGINGIEYESHKRFELFDVFELL